MRACSLWLGGVFSALYYRVAHLLFSEPRFRRSWLFVFMSSPTRQHLGSRRFAAVLFSVQKSLPQFGPACATTERLAARLPTRCLRSIISLPNHSHCPQLPRQGPSRSVLSPDFRNRLSNSDQCHRSFLSLRHVAAPHPHQGHAFPRTRRGYWHRSHLERARAGRARTTTGRSNIFCCSSKVILCFLWCRMVYAALRPTGFPQPRARESIQLSMSLSRQALRRSPIRTGEGKAPCAILR
jgi:hypothetical protein